MPELTILMPCLNEAETLELCIAKAQTYLEKAGIDGEVLVADNGSKDGSQEIARRSGARVVEIPVKGYGAALIGGIVEARGTYVIMGDSDDSYDFSDLDCFVSELRNGAELVIGNRFKGGIKKSAMPPLHRYLGNPILSAVGRIFYKTPAGDFHCGLRGFSREAIIGLHLNTPGMEFASEMLIRATLAGLDIREVPVVLSPDGRSRPPHLRSWRDGWSHLKLLLTFAPYWLFYYPGLVLMGLGSFSFIGLLFGPVRVGTVRFDITTLLLTSVFIITGFQMICFYVLAQLFSVRFNLLPASDRYEWIRRKINVDNACISGAALLLFSIIVVILGFFSWASSGFGDLEPSRIIRLAALAIICASIGMQVIITGFLSSILQQPIKGLPDL
jgi:glycosyltransferase involved in cell wall biosynthesis